jgi:hypothetical protein
VLWIDAICVNQQDLEERSSQVKRMPDIYSTATRVVVWLGPQSCNSALAIECAETVSSNISVDWENATMAPLSAESESLWSEKDSAMPLNKAQILAIAGFLSRSWFERLWIRQEISLARDAIAMCGPQSVPWLAIRDIVFCIYVSVKQRIFEDNIPLKRQKMLYNLCSGRQSQDFGSLLSQAKYCICSDPRDKVFALLSLSDEKGVKIEPDYTKSLYEVYQDVMLQFISARNLRLLSTIEMHEHLEGIPSWVPDWASPRLSEALSYFQTGTGFDAVVEFQQGGILQVSCVPVTVIERTEAFNFNQSESTRLGPQSSILELQRVVSQMGFRDRPFQNKQELRELCQTLCANQCSDRFYPSYSGYLTLRICEESLMELLNLRTNIQGMNVSQEAFRFCFGVKQCCDGRSLFRNAQGRLGLGPKTARAGDIVTVVLGLNSALVLRPRNDNKFQVVGEAYYGGVMEGEALLGPFPDGIQNVIRYSLATQQSHAVYSDRNKNTATTVDPRLGDMPLGWKIESDPEDEVLQWFVNEETGERTWNDPRRTLELLKKRGVDLQVFDLI